MSTEGPEEKEKPRDDGFCVRCGGADESGWLLHIRPNQVFGWGRVSWRTGGFGERVEYEVVADRCTVCGHLEMRAGPRRT
jgi:hypothetical protein